MAPRLDRSKCMAKSQAQQLYCLTARELDGLPAEERPNPRNRSGPPMKLLAKEDLERAALAKYGSMAALEAERERRRERREQRSIASYFQPQAAPAQQQDGHPQQQPNGQPPPPPQQQQQVGQQGQEDQAQDGQQQVQQQEQQHLGSQVAAPLPFGQQPVPQPVQEQQQQQRGPPPAPGSGPLPWRQALPPLISERVCMVPRQQTAAPAAAATSATAAAAAEAAPGTQQAQQADQPAYVLYWMKTAVRGHENPALDAAAAAARQHGLPLLVASFLLASHPYASTRRNKFWLEGLRDAQAELRRQDVELLVYLEGWSDQQQQCEDKHGQLEGQQQQPEGQQQQSTGKQQQPGAQQQQEERPMEVEPSSTEAGGPAEGPAAAQLGLAAAAAQAAADPYDAHFSFHAQGFRQTAGWQALVRLASRAALVVTEDMPVPPDADWLQALAEDMPAAIPMAAVDTACVLPMRLVRKFHERAYTFRSATEAQRRQRLKTYAPPPATLLGPAAVAPAALHGLPALPQRAADPGQLGWQPLELASIPPLHLQQRLRAVLQACQGIDHSVPSVTHLPGGSVAGYARWEAFRKKGLPLYAARRNDAMQRDGVSRLSAYHHFGMVSPFKIAREAALDKTAGGTKFLDELLIWREIGFNLCLHRHHQLHSLAGLPQWARATLEEHAGDPRPGLLPYSQLDRGASGDAFWDAAQKQLVRTGELHNNVRMTWGKAFLQWGPTPEAALRAALHCNHRWALDGCDPASYAGILWCFGLYDSPKGSAGTPISGSLAQRSTAGHARRLPPAAYSQLPV